MASGSVAPGEGLLMLALGAVVSLECSAGASWGSSVAGWDPISASRLTVNCCMLGSGGLFVGSVVPTFQAFWAASPHDHCTVPAPNTSAPLGARYSARW